MAAVIATILNSLRLGLRRYFRIGIIPFSATLIGNSYLSYFIKGYNPTLTVYKGALVISIIYYLTFYIIGDYFVLRRNIE